MGPHEDSRQPDSPNGIGYLGPLEEIIRQIAGVEQVEHGFDRSIVHKNHTGGHAALGFAAVAPEHGQIIHGQIPVVCPHLVGLMIADNAFDLEALCRCRCRCPNRVLVQDTGNLIVEVSRDAHQPPQIPGEYVLPFPNIPGLADIVAAFRVREHVPRVHALGIGCMLLHNLQGMYAIVAALPDLPEVLDDARTFDNPRAQSNRVFQDLAAFAVESAFGELIINLILHALHALLGGGNVVVREVGHRDLFAVFDHWFAAVNHGGFVLGLCCQFGNRGCFQAPVLIIDWELDIGETSLGLLALGPDDVHEDL